MRTRAVEPQRLALPPRLEMARRNALAGRAAERALFARALEHAGSGGREVVLVSGEPGIGKTRLAAEVAGDAFRAGATVLYARCDAELRLPYGPIVEALDHLVSSSSRETLEALLGDAASELVRILPRLSLVFEDLATTRTAETEGERWLLWSAVARTLRRVAADGPILLLLDDVHWADDPSLALVRHLLLGPEPLLGTVGLLYRPTELGEGDAFVSLLADIGREEDTSATELGGLSDQEALELVSTVAERELDEDERRLGKRLREETGGNPLYLRQMVRHLTETGSFGSTARSPDSAPGGLPGDVRDVITRRANRLGGAVSEVLDAASVVGGEFDASLVGEVTGVGGDALAGALDAATAGGLVEPVDDVAARFSFVHAVVGRTFYEALPAASRGRLHRRIAEALEAKSGGSEGAGEMARHWLAALPADPMKALPHAAAAGSLALKGLAPEEAAGWLSRALEIQESHASGDLALRCDLLTGLGDAQRQMGDAGFRESLLEASRLADQTSDAQRLVAAVLTNTRGFASGSAVVDGERVALLEAALATSPDDPLARADILALLAAELTFGGDWPRRKALSDEALAVAREQGDPHTLARVLLLRYVATWVPSTLSDRLAETEEGAALADRIGDPLLQTAALRWRVGALQQAGRFEEMVWVDKSFTESTERLGQPTGRWVATYSRANIMSMFGELELAESLANEAFAIGTASGQPDAVAFYANQMVGIRREQGRLAELQPMIARAAGETSRLTAFRAMLALALCEDDLHDDARELFAASKEERFADLHYDVVWQGSLFMLAEVASELGDADAAGWLHGLLAPYEEQIAEMAGCGCGSVNRVLGRLATLLGHFDEAEERLENASRRYERLGTPVWLARARLDHGRLLLTRRASGDAKRAVALLEAAESEARRLGSAVVERRSRALRDRERTFRALATSRPPAAGSREGVLRREGGFWVLGLGDSEWRVRHLNGISYLATLIASPGVDLHVLDLQTPGDSGSEVRAAARSRVADLRQELEEAESLGDSERAARASEELQLIEDSLVDLLGLGANGAAGAAGERARLNVTRALRRALARITEADVPLGQELSLCVRTGRFCAYDPPPGRSITWSVDTGD